ncbi:MAG: PorP/SprF family type IX secretion system membrane protein [Bacteroidetes bacterium]|nr:PorP/SprF family type IX secretion system membrane protein [Bacteroidota bacterium]
MKKRIFTICALFFLTQTRAQDIHLSQFWATPLYLNPAQAGVFDGDYRAGMVYRNQWRAIPVPYSTFSFLGDAKISRAFSQHSDAGVGLVFNNDVSGDSRYSINQMYVPLSYIQRFKSDTNLNISVGISPGISNIAFNTSKLTYDNQFDGDAYNPALPSGESYPTQTKTYFDMAAGIAAQYNFKRGGFISAGSSLSHLTRPNISFFKSEGVNLYIKSTSYLNLKYRIKNLLFLLADVMYQQQGPFHETIIATRLSYTINQGDNIAFNFGVAGRLGDAAIALVGMDYKSFRAGIAYDVNTSRFNPATNKRGAFEISILYIFKKKPLFIPKKRACPVYM